ncbi:hypothetical protein [Streptomyces sp. adm13(2018)]|uniref:hypothetical protein n=1 Tax=Streptomyces sp. adm13(2018) TaxID=2479007 RepID=UPI0011CDE8CF|nr:hypothetical protein [Streptomyces sp. adm13(2018)]
MEFAQPRAQGGAVGDHAGEAGAGEAGDGVARLDCVGELGPQRGERRLALDPIDDRAGGAGGERLVVVEGQVLLRLFQLTDPNGAVVQLVEWVTPTADASGA